MTLMRCWVCERPHLCSTVCDGLHQCVFCGRWFGGILEVLTQELFRRGA